MSISRQSVALNGITKQQRGEGEEEEAALFSRARRNANSSDNGKGTKGATETTAAAPPKKAKEDVMKNRIYTSQISYPSVQVGSANPGGRIFGYSSGNLTSSGHNSTMERDRIRTEFYATYDVMTGIRIAGTLGGFFAFVILLVMFKSRSHTNQALKDPKIVAVAAAVVLEEEERELQEKLDATGLSLYADDINYEYRRQRLLSLGGFDPALIDSSRRYSYGYAGGVRPSYGSTNRPNMSRQGSSRRSSSTVRTISRCSYDTFRDQYHPRDEGNEFIMVEQDEQLEMENEFQEIEFRSQPPPRASSYDSRRCSSITCCSTESSYLERRCSALTLGIYSIGASLVQPPTMTTATPSTSNQIQDGTEEFTMPVPGAFHQNPSSFYAPSSATISTNRAHRSNSSRRFSGRSSRRSSFMRRNRDDATDVSITMAVDTDTATATSTTLKGTAPLASLSSFRISSIDPELRSLGSDSVFCEQYVDTDEEVAQFSSDSEGEGETGDVEEGGHEEKKNVFVENPIREDFGESKSITLAEVSPGGREEVLQEAGDSLSCSGKLAEAAPPSNVLQAETDPSSVGNRMVAAEEALPEVELGVVDLTR